MSIEELQAKAKKHWTKWCPHMVKDMKKQNLFDKLTLGAAKRAQFQIDQLIKAGYQKNEAEEVVLPDEILIPPEKPGSWDEDEEDSPPTQMTMSPEKLPPDHDRSQEPLLNTTEETSQKGPLPMCDCLSIKMLMKQEAQEKIPPHTCGGILGPYSVSRSQDPLKIKAKQPPSDSE